jgi:HEXXH motif-containing protein
MAADRPKPLAPPGDLTLPDPGSTTARDVLSRAIGRLLAELHAIARAPEAQPLRVILRAPPGAIASLLRQPTLGVLVRCLRERASRPAILTELMTLLGFELALRGALPAPIRIERPPSILTSPSTRRALSIAGAEAITFDAGRATVHRSVDTHLDLGRESDHYHPIAGHIVLALADNNPLAMIEAHPDKQGNAVDLGGHDPREWVSRLAEALDLIDRCLPDLRRELDLFIHQIIPVGWDAERHLSASYREAIGSIYLSLHPSLMTMAEALIHEFSHNKMNALLELDDVLENAFTSHYTSPIRPDPRPLHGVLLAIHAFLPVARLYEIMIERGHPLSQPPTFQARYDAIRAINREAAAVLLENARPTPIGRAVLDEIQRWSRHFD